MVLAVMNNLPELIGGVLFGSLCFWLGRKTAGWRPLAFLKKN